MSEPLRKERYVQTKRCAHCGAAFQAARSHARTCSARCKKAVQRATKKSQCKAASGKHVPLLAAAKKGTWEQVVSLAEIMRKWAHGKEVTYNLRGRWMPGRINWLSRCGQELIDEQKTPRPMDRFEVPVETLMSVERMFNFDVSVSPF